MEPMPLIENPKKNVTPTNLSSITAVNQLMSYEQNLTAEPLYNHSMEPGPVITIPNRKSSESASSHPKLNNVITFQI